MTPSNEDRLARLRARKEPPPLVAVTVTSHQVLTPRMLCLTIQGDGLVGMEPGPAASVRLLVPSPDNDALVWPKWNGNEFLLPDGSRPALRTFTPLRVDASQGTMDLEIVRHAGGVVSQWAETALPGATAALSGPGRAHKLDTESSRYLLLGDETALPALRQLLSVLPSAVEVEAHVEVVTKEAIPPVDPTSQSITWHVSDGEVPGDGLVGVIAALDHLDTSTHVWAAGEAAAMQAIRTHLFERLELPRSRATVRGYWKPARR